MDQADWTDYRFFLAVAEAGTLGRAAERLKVNQSTVYRRIDALEARLEVRLFDRHQRGYALTDEGRMIVEDIGAVAARFAGIEARLKGREKSLAGTLHISTTDTLGYFWLPTHIASFANAYPDISVDMDITTRFRNLSRREADIVLSASNQQPDTMVGRALAPIHFRLYAAKSYLAGKAIGSDKLASDTFASHRWLLPNDKLAHVGVSKWLAEQPGINTIAAYSDKFSGLYYLCVCGLGVAPLPAYAGDQNADLVALAEVPENYSSTIWMLTHPELRNNARVVAFMRHMRGVMV